MNNSTFNETFLNKPAEGMRDTVLGGTLFGINICIVFLNSLALMVIMRFRTKNCIDILVLGLALTDLTKGLIPVPMSVCIYLSSWYLKEGSAACDFFGWIAFTTNSASMLILTMMAIERFVAIAKPFAYRSVITKRRMEISVLIAVVFSALVSLLPVLGVGQMIPYNQGAYCHFDYSSKTTASQIYSICILIYGFSLTIIVMAAYSIVFYKIRDLIKRHRKFSVAKILAKVSVSDGKQRKDINLKVEKMFSYLTVGLMLLFWFSWFPFLIVVFASQTGLQTPHDKVDLFAIRVAVVNAMLNPLACASFCKPYRRGFLYYYKKVLSYAGFARPNSDVFDPWRQRSQQANREPTPGNSFTMQSEPRSCRSRPWTEINSHTDSGFVSDSLSRFGRIPSILEPIQNQIRNESDYAVGESERKLSVRLQPVEECSHIITADMMDDVDITSSNAGPEFSSTPEESSSLHNAAPEPGCSNSSKKTDVFSFTKTLISDPDRAKLKRHSIPIFQYCTRQERKPRPKSLDITPKKHWKYRPWSLGRKNDLRHALHGYAQTLQEEIQLISYTSNRTEGEKSRTKPIVKTSTSSELKELEIEQNVRQARVANNQKCLLVKAETFSDFDKTNSETLDVFKKLKKQFSPESCRRQAIFAKKRSSSSPTDYNPKLYSNYKYLSLQKDLHDSLQQIDHLTKDLLVLSGSNDKGDEGSDVFVQQESINSHLENDNLGIHS